MGQELGQELGQKVGQEINKWKLKIPKLLKLKDLNRYAKRRERFMN